MPHIKMKSLYPVIVPLFILAAFGGCHITAPKEDITGLWDIDNGSGEDDHLAANAYLNLRKDNTFTFYQPYYFDFGHWSFDGHKIKLVSERKKILYKKVWELVVTYREQNVLKVSYAFADEKADMPDPIKADAKEKIAYKVHKNIFLRRNDLRFDAARDPFSIPHSQWRIHPDHEESCKELQARITGNLDHLCLLFGRYADTSTETISWLHSPHPFILGSNGVAMHVNSSVPDTWANIFYNASNEEMAYNMMSYLFKEDIDVPLHIKAYTDMWYPILRQMDSFSKVRDMCGAKLSSSK